MGYIEKKYCTVLYIRLYIIYNIDMGLSENAIKKKTNSMVFIQT